MGAELVGDQGLDLADPAQLYPSTAAVRGEVGALGIA